MGSEKPSDIFVVWARCKWDGKVRGFILEKACHIAGLVLSFRKFKVCRRA